MKSKFTAGVLCLLLGGLGIHEFYLGDTKKGIYYIIAFVICAITGWGAIAYLLFQLGVAIYYFTMNQAKFDEKYNGITPGDNAAYNPNPSAGAFKPIDSDFTIDPQEPTIKRDNNTKIERIKELKQLFDERLISQEEFDIKKREILNS